MQRYGFTRLSQAAYKAPQAAAVIGKRLYNTHGAMTFTCPSYNQRRLIWAGTALATMSVAAFGYNVAYAKDQKRQKYKYVIIGAGVAARSCFKTIVEGDIKSAGEGYTGKILMLGNDPRMNSIGYSEDDHKELQQPTDHADTELLLGHNAKKLDIKNKTIELDDGTVVAFDKLFIATGGHYPTMKNVSPAAKSKVTTFRRKEDLQRLLDGIKSGEIKKVMVVGGGALGTEVSLALRKYGGKDLAISQVYAEPGTMHRNLPDYFRAYNTALLRAKNIEQHNFSLVSNVDLTPTGKVNAQIDSWEQYFMEVDHVIFAPTHIDAETDLAADAGLEIDHINSGIVVNSELQAFSDIYVGGDAASYPSGALGRRRDQNFQHATKSGQVAATNMLGGRAIYSNIPVSEISLKDIGLHYTLIGNADARLETIGFWEMKKQQKKCKTDEQHFFTSKYSKGVVFYLDDGRVVGVMLTNLEDKDEINKAQLVINDKVDYSDLKRADLEQELRSHVGHELQLPMVRTTFGKGTKTKKKTENLYKQKRHQSAVIKSHPSDTITDANTNLYWRTA